jgi:hypothetical protein
VRNYGGGLHGAKREMKYWKNMRQELNFFFSFNVAFKVFVRKVGEKNNDENIFWCGIFDVGVGFASTDGGKFQIMPSIFVLT